jgi:hypothetical protein
MPVSHFRLASHNVTFVTFVCVTNKALPLFVTFSRIAKNDSLGSTVPEAVSL